MSIAGHGRRLDRLERRGGTDEDFDLAEVLQEGRRRSQAVYAIVDFVRSLAGTDKSETPPFAFPAVERATDSVPHSPPAPPQPVARPPETRPPEDHVPRPDRNAVLTWDEFMRLSADTSKRR